MDLRSLLAGLLLVGVVRAPAIAACAGGPTTSFTVTGEVEHPSVFDLNSLRQLPTAQQNVTYFAAGSVVSQSFAGALLWDLLNKPPVGGIVVDPAIKNDILRKIVTVTGSDCYQIVFGAGELDPFFGGNQIMVAYAVDAQPLGNTGFARVVVPGDKTGGRFTSMITNIDVVDPSSSPAALPGKVHE